MNQKYFFDIFDAEGELVCKGQTLEVSWDYSFGGPTIVELRGYIDSATKRGAKPQVLRCECGR
jgi:hypothetical protein